MSSVCRECLDGLDHCHGTVVNHAVAGVECTEDCGAPDGLHAFRIDCEAVGCACGETAAVARVS